MSAKYRAINLTIKLAKAGIDTVFVLGAPEVVFGEIEGKEQPINIRSHGSHHEAAIPIMGSVARAPVHEYRYNLDIARHLELD